MMIFERPLAEKPIVSFMSEDTFVFKPHENDQEKEDKEYLMDVGSLVT